jgi:hypothetical protein
MHAEHHATDTTKLFSGNIIIFHAFDVGDDINIEKVSATKDVVKIDTSLPKYFRKYHVPVNITLPDASEGSRCTGSKIYRFGALSLTYKIPFHNDTLENLRKNLDSLYNSSREQSVIDAQKVFSKIQQNISKPRFYHTNATYIVIQVDQKDTLDATVLQREFGSTITSMLRFETQTLSEEQKNDILSSAIGYFRGDLVIVDTDVSFVYDTDYEETMDLFEFANIQQLELHFFDRALDQKLNFIYDNPPAKLKLRNYLPFVSTLESDPINVLSKLQVDISVIIERLESSVMLSGEPYFAELYELLMARLELKSWRASVDRKLSIIKDVQSNYQNRVDANREDMLTVLIIILIFIELMVGVLNYFKA